MAFDAKGLDVQFTNCWAGVGPTNNLKEATYVTPDTSAVVEAANYFLAAFDRLPLGTLLRVISVFAGTPRLKQYVVTVSSSTTVTIVLQATTAG